MAFLGTLQRGETSADVLGNALGTGLQSLAHAKLQDMQAKRKQDQSTAFWKSTGLKDENAGVLSDQSEDIQKEYLKQLFHAENEKNKREYEEKNRQPSALETKNKEVGLENQRQLNAIRQGKKLINESGGKTSLGFLGNITPQSKQGKEFKQLQQIAASLIPADATDQKRKLYMDKLLPNMHDTPEEQFAKLDFLEKQLTSEEQAVNQGEQNIVGQQTQPITPEQIAASPEAQAAQNNMSQPGQQPEAQGYNGAPSESTPAWLGRQVAGSANQLVGLPYNAAKIGAHIGEGLQNYIEDKTRQTTIKALENALEKGGDYLYGSDPEEVKKDIERLKKTNPITPTTDLFREADKKIKDFQDVLTKKVSGKENYLTPEGDLEENTQDLLSSVGLAIATGTPWGAVAHIAKRVGQGIAAKQGVKEIGGGEGAQALARIGFPLLLDMFSPAKIIKKVAPIVDTRYKQAEKLAGAQTINVDPLRKELEKIGDTALGHPQYNTYSKDLNILERQLGSPNVEFPVKDLPKLKERINRFAYKFNLDEFKPAVPAVHELINEASSVNPKWGEEIRKLDKMSGALAKVEGAKTFTESLLSANSWRSIPTAALKAIKAIFYHPQVKGFVAFNRLGYQDRKLAFKYASEMLEASANEQKGNFIKAATNLGNVLEKKK